MLKKVKEIFPLKCLISGLHFNHISTQKFHLNIQIILCKRSDHLVTRAYKQPLGMQTASKISMLINITQLTTTDTIKQN